MAFYAVFPMLMAAATTFHRSVVVFVVTLLLGYVAYEAATVAFAGSGAPGLLVEFYAARWLPSQLPVFAAGVVAYFLVSSDRLRDARGKANVLLALLLAILASLPWMPKFSPDLSSVYAAVFCAIAFCLARGAGHWLVARPVQLLGTISFSAYLWHFAILSLARSAGVTVSGGLELVGGIVLVLALTIVGSAATYLAIERPMIAFGAKLASRRERAKERSVLEARLPASL